MRESDGEVYLTIQEVEAKYGWGSSTLYYFRSTGRLKNFRFVGDKRSYWRASDVEALKNLPPEERTPKPDALTSFSQQSVGTAVGTDTGIHLPVSA